MKIVLFATSDAYLRNFRGALAASLHEAGHEVLMVAPPGPCGEEFIACGYRWCPAPMERAGMNPFKELWLIFWLARLFRRERVDLVHGFIIKGAVYGGLAGRLAGVPARIGSITGLGYLFLNNSLLTSALRRLVRVLFRIAFSGPSVRVIVQNRDDLKLFRDERLARPDILRMILGSGVDCEQFAPSDDRDGRAPTADSAGQSPRPYRVLLPARLLWHKGIGDYVDAAHRLATSRRKIDFLIAGQFDSGSPSSIDRETLGAWIDSGDVEWLGFVEDMPALLREVDVVVLPSYREGLPKALVEGAACQLPLITTDVPGCREVVIDGVDGLLVPPRCPAALADAIARLQDDPETRVAMGRAGRARALEQFSQRVILRQTLELYSELIPEFGRERHSVAGSVG